MLGPVPASLLLEGDATAGAAPRPALRAPLASGAERLRGADWWPPGSSPLLQFTPRVQQMSSC